MHKLHKLLNKQRYKIRKKQIHDKTQFIRDLELDSHDKIDISSRTSIIPPRTPIRPNIIKQDKLKFICEYGKNHVCICFNIMTCICCRDCHECVCCECERTYLISGLCYEYEYEFSQRKKKIHKRKNFC